MREQVSNVLSEKDTAPPKSYELNAQQLLIKNESFRALFIIT